MLPFFAASLFCICLQTGSAAADTVTLKAEVNEDFRLDGGTSVTADPLLCLRSGNPGQKSSAAFPSQFILAPGATVEGISFSYRYISGFGPEGKETGTNFSLRIGGTRIYTSPHYTDFVYDKNRTNYSIPVQVNLKELSIKIPTSGDQRVELDFANNDRNLQLLLPLAVDVSCADGSSCVAPAPPPPPPAPRNYCPTGAKTEAELAPPSNSPFSFTSIPLGSGSSMKDVGNCVKPDGTTAPCAPGNQMCPPGPFPRTAPQFHVRDASCGENDPNGPVYDPVHGVYHLHYQNHVGCRGGRTYGHAVSRDFIHWAHMPISIWNDHDYDEHAIYTGSATVVDGKVVQVYPGLCYAQFSANCPGGTNLAIAVPADPSDPLQTNWTKDVFAANPIVNNTGRDPSTAWKTPAGEWRLTTFDTIIMGSMDFKTWYRIGKQPGFPVGECPSFFPLPRTTPGAGPAPAGAHTPTHVHKASHGGKDWMQVGTYTAGPPRSNGNWTALLPEVRIDAGNFYASKDFYDPVKDRRINWGWATVPPASTQTLPREVTWHPELQQLVYSPVEEQDSLRGAVIGSLQNKVLTPNISTPLNLPKQAGNQSEIKISFERPSAAVRLSVNVMVDKQTSAKGTEFFINYEPSTGNGAVKVQVGSPGHFDTLSLLPDDRTIDLTLYVDNTFTEAFWMGGRVAMTMVTKSSGGNDDVTVSASNPGVTVSATVWKVGSIWVTPEVVKQTPRRDSDMAILI